MSPMRILRPRSQGYQPSPRPHRLPPEHPSSWQVLAAGGPIGAFARYAAERQPCIVGGNGPRCRIDPTATIGNVHINATSGVVEIAPHVAIAPGVSLVAGTHDMTQRGADRKRAIPDDGFDIRIDEGVFIGTNATVVGPCTIGRDTVVAAGSIVTRDVPAGAIFAGVPARVIRHLDESSA